MVICVYEIGTCFVNTTTKTEEKRTVLVPSGWNRTKETDHTALDTGGL